MDAKSRHRKVLLVVSAIVCFVACLAIILMLAKEISGLSKAVKACEDQRKAEQCQCEAYPLPQDGMSIPDEPRKFVADSQTSQRIYDYFAATEYNEVADIIVAMNRLETGNNKSQFHLERHNYFSTKRKPDGDTCKEGGERECFSTHRSLEDSCRYTLQGVFRKRGYRTDRQGFLEDLVLHGYAEDPLYVSKVLNIARKLSLDS